MMRFPARVGLLLPAAMAAGCALSPLRAYDPAGLPGGSVILDVPLVRQQDRQTCGFSGAEMLSRYYGAPMADEDCELLRLTAASEKGVSGQLLREVLERNGYRVYIFRGELLDEENPKGIAYHLKRGRPLLVMVSPRGSRDHYMVVSGLSAEKDLVVFEDPDRGKVMCRGGAFRKMWERSNFFTLLAVPVKMGSHGDVSPAAE